MAVLVMVLGILLFTRLQGELQASADRSLRVQADSLASGVMAGNAAFGDTTFPGIVGGLPFSQLVNLNGKVLESSEALGQRSLLRPSVLRAIRLPTFSSLSIHGVVSPVRLLAVPVESAGARLVVVTGLAMTRQEQVLSSFLGVLIAAGILVVLTAGAAGWLLAGAVLRPVEKMRREAAAITASDQQRRLPVPANDDEISRLSITLNDMLTRLHESFRREQRFVDDASHELRTPLAVLKGELELGLSRPRSTSELEGVVTRSLEATDELIALAQNLLVLARTDAGRSPLERREVRIDTIVESVVADFAQRATINDVAIEFAATDQLASLDDLRLRQALNNVVDNALSHTPPGGRVVIRAESNGGEVRFEVRDTGTGVAAEILESAFEPFVRGPLRRAAMAPGAGLGLTIVRSIAQSHGGTVSLRNIEEGGTVVTILLPAVHTV
jgi:signal transduction histidine kinase